MKTDIALSNCNDKNRRIPFAEILRGSWTRSQWGRAQVRRSLIRAGSLILFLVFLITHIPEIVTTSSGLDDSWVKILIHLHKHAFQFGEQVIFTYGPLGYLLFPADGPLLFSSCCVFIPMLLLFVVCFRHVKTIFDLFLLFCFVLISQGGNAFELFTFLIPLLVWQFTEKERNTCVKYGGLVLLSVMGAFCIYIKFMSFPVIVFSLLAADILLLFSRRPIAALPSFCIALPLVWCTAAGQKAGNLWSFFYKSWHIAAGYNDAMFRDTLSPVWVLLLITVALCLALMILSAARNITSIAKRCIFVPLLVSSVFVAYKYGVVRSDFSTISSGMRDLSIIASAYAFCLRLNWKWRSFLIVLCIILAGISTWHLGVPFYDIQYYQNASTCHLWVPYAGICFYMLITLLFFSPLAVYMIFRFRLRYYPLLAVFMISTVLSLFGLILPSCTKLNALAWDESRLRPRKAFTADCFSHRIDPLLQSGMTYRPRLVFQSYSAYTPLLLKENAAHLTGSGAPDFIFYGYQSLDNRIPAAIDPSALLRLLTRYRPVQGKKMLRRTDPEQKTMPLRKIASSSTSFGQVVNVPAGLPFVCLSLNIHNSLPGEILKYAVRPAAVDIRLFLDNGKTITHKLIPKIADVPFLLSPYLKDWAKLELLFEPGVPQLPRVVAFSVSPSIHCFSHYFPKLADYDQKLGMWAFGKDIQIHFYAFQPDSDGKNTGSNRNE